MRLQNANQLPQTRVPGNLMKGGKKRGT